MSRTLAAGIALVFALSFSIGSSAQAQEITLESAPPVVVETTPKAGAADVDPATTEIKVSFSKAMKDKSWSWSTASKETFPETAGQPSYRDDGKTCVLPVKLVAGKTYAIWINSAKFRGFQDAGGQAAVPYLIVFKTKG